MAYFNNLTVGGTAKFLQDVKWPGLKSTAEELNALHSEEGLVDGFVFTKDTPYDEVIGDEYYNVKNKSFGLIKDNYYTFKYKRNGKIISSETVQAIELPADDIGISGAITLESEDWYFYDNLNIDSTGTPIAGGHMWCDFPDNIDEIIMEGIVTSGKLTHQGIVYNTIPLNHIPKLTADKLPQKIEEVSDPRIEIDYDDQFRKPYRLEEEGLLHYISNNPYRIYPRKIGLKIGNEYKYEITTLKDGYNYATSSSGVTLCQAMEFDGIEYPIVFIDDSSVPAVIDGLNFNRFDYECYEDDTYCINTKYTSDTDRNAGIKLTGEDIDGNPLITKTLYSKPVIETDIIGSASTLHGLNLTVEEINKIPVNSVGRKGAGNYAEIFNDSYNDADGNYSHAEGDSTSASGYASHAEGSDTSASGGESHAEGSGTVAAGADSHAEGFQTYAGNFAHAEGHRTSAKGQSSHAEGHSTNKASGTTEDAILSAWNKSNLFSCAFGKYSHVEGINALALGEASHVEGVWTRAKNSSAHAEGIYSAANGRGAHVEGVGSNVVPDSLLSDDTTIEDIESSWKTAKFNYAKGEAAHTEGCNCLALNNYSHAEGYYTKSTGERAHTEGNKTIASGNNAHAEGSETTASGGASHAEGFKTKALGDFAHAEGTSTIASGHYSHAAGCQTKANANISYVIGKYNKNLDESGNIVTKLGDVFVIGNGTGETDSERSNGFRVTYKGETYGLSAFNSAGADYAEFIYPWFDDNSENEDRVGYFVTFKDGKLHKATSKDIILGITSGNPSVVGNADEDYYWRYERDEFNRIVFEDVEEEIQKLDEEGNPIFDDNNQPVMEKTGNIIKNGRMKLNENYDPTLQDSYVERKDRKEWDYVGMLGILPTRDDGTCIPGQYCKCNDDGIATLATAEDVATNRFTFIVLERVSDNVVKIVLK